MYWTVTSLALEILFELWSRNILMQLRQKIYCWCATWEPDSTFRDASNYTGRRTSVHSLTYFAYIKHYTRDFVVMLVRINPGCAESLFGKHKHVIWFHTISRHWNVVGYWNSLSTETGTSVVHIVNTHSCWWRGDERNYGIRSHAINTIDQSHKSHNAPVPYPTIHHL